MTATEQDREIVGQLPPCPSWCTSHDHEGGGTFHHAECGTFLTIPVLTDGPHTEDSVSIMVYDEFEGGQIARHGAEVHTLDSTMTAGEARRLAAALVRAADLIDVEVGVSTPRAVTA